MNTMDLAVPFLIAVFVSSVTATFTEMTAAHVRISGAAPAHFKGAKVTLRNVCIILTISSLHIPLPTSDAYLLPPLLWYLIAELWFALSHRMMHTPKLFRFHKQHHTDTSPPTATDALNCGLVELFFVNTLTVMLGPLLFPSTYWVTVAWICAAVYNAFWSHSNIRGKSDTHSLHHRYYYINFGTGFYILDRLMGTYQKE